MAYFLGMDAGGTTTFTVITDEKGNVCGVGRGGNGNFHIGRQSAEESIFKSTQEALKEANLTTEDIDYAWFGMAGGDREEDLVILRSILDDLNMPNYDVSGDITIAFRAGTNKPYGIIIICGSGVNCAGTNKQLQFYQCGGLGFNFGDYGGGNSLAVETFRAVCRAWDGRGEPTILTELVLKELDYPSVEKMYFDMFDKVLNDGIIIPVQLTKVLFTAANKGDQVAKELLKKQGIELGLSAKATIENLEMYDDAFDIVLAGSVVTRGSNDIIHNEMKKMLLPIAPKVTLKPLTVEPVVGALLLAMESAGHTVSDAVQENLNKITHI